MSLSSVPYFFATCSGKTNNLRNPKCLSEGPGSFDESEAAARATESGWALGAKSYCPAHRDQIPAATPEGDAVPTRRRRKRTDANTDTEQFGFDSPQGEA